MTIRLLVGFGLQESVDALQDHRKRRTVKLLAEFQS